jgi:hypothetical protein
MLPKKLRSEASERQLPADVYGGRMVAGGDSAGCFLQASVANGSRSSVGATPCATRLE